MLTFSEVTKTYDGVTAVDRVSLDIPRGQFVALVGQSGSGKSTLLGMVNRLVTPDSGSVSLAGGDVRGAEPAPALRRRIGYVFQSIGLFPHMDVAANIGIAPRVAGSPLEGPRIRELLELVGLGPEHAARMPSELSGGQRQRVAVARALAAQPEVLLLDEPFGALDPVTRDAIGRRVRELHDRLRLTTVMVTHDMAEALLLADRVVVMARGRLEADETPRALLGGAGGNTAQSLVAIPRAQAEALEALLR